MMQLYDQEEIMRMHDIGIAMRATVETCQDFGIAFVDAVEKIAEKFSVSSKRAEEVVAEYGKE